MFDTPDNYCKSYLSQEPRAKEPNFRFAFADLFYPLFKIFYKFFSLIDMSLGGFNYFYIKYDYFDSVDGCCRLGPFGAIHFFWRL